MLIAIIKCFPVDEEASKRSSEDLSFEMLPGIAVLPSAPAEPIENVCRRKCLLGSKSH